jgi:hypothetical protein
MAINNRVLEKTSADAILAGIGDFLKRLSRLRTRARRQRRAAHLARAVSSSTAYAPLRGPSESYSDVILKLVEIEGRGAASAYET